MVTIDARPSRRRLRALRRIAVAAGSVGALLACGRAGTPARSDTVASTPTQQSASPAPAAVPYYLDPAEDCGLLRSALFPDPVALVRLYVERDHDARFLQSDPVMDSVYACPNHLPGPDEFTVVRSSTVAPLAVGDSVARVLVTSPVLGRMTQDSVGLVFVPGSGVAADTFLVVRTPFGWRIEAPQLPNRVHGAAVLGRPERFPLRPEVRTTLEAAVAGQ